MAETTKQLNIRLTAKETEKLEAIAEAQSITVSAVARELINCGRVIVTQADDKLYTELCRIGNNLNQIAKQLNICKESALSVATIAELRSTQEVFYELFEILKNERKH